MQRVQRVKGLEAVSRGTLENFIVERLALARGLNRGRKRESARTNLLSLSLYYAYFQYPRFAKRRNASPLLYFPPSASSFHDPLPLPRQPNDYRIDFNLGFADLFWPRSFVLGRRKNAVSSRRK